MYLKWAFWIICALQFLVSSLELHYQIIKNSLCVNFYYNNYNLAPSPTLNYISYKTTDLLFLMTSVGWVLSRRLRTATIIHCSWFNHDSPSCSPLELSRRGSVPRRPCSRDTIQETELPSAQSRCGRTPCPSKLTPWFHTIRWSLSTREDTRDAKQSLGFLQTDH